ncbi:rRNA maturation RNase YbeY [Prosthecobacter sp.]|jgi:probable rRNA maturation factor|uniref:rRNA maturation RNase YbeY n=1 Tax=Prosthecobacter sp. TaxID=1965333 RepID=UPI003783E5D2
MLPKLSIYNRQRGHKIALPWLRKIGAAAMPACVAAIRSSEAPLSDMPLVEVSIVSDKEIARVHGEFLDDPTPTDVITFHHGEILISADTADRQGREHSQPFDHEIALYLVHGLLHLAGWDDHEKKDAREMALRQSAILRDALKAV